MKINLLRLISFSLVFLFLTAGCSGKNGTNGTNGNSGSNGSNGQQLTSTTGTITGVVEDKNTGAGVPSAVVSLLGANISTASDSSGNYILKNIQQGEYTLQATKNYYLSSSISAQVVSGTATTINLSLVPIGEVYGTITDQATNAPIQNASVTIGGQTSYTNQNGSYYVINIIPGKYEAYIKASDYNTDSLNVNVTGGQQTTLNVGLYLLGAITGRVVSASTGVPITGASVYGGGSFSITDSNGYYTLSNVMLGPQNITANEAGFDPSASTATVISNNTVTVNFVLHPSGLGTITGYITDANTGAGVSGVFVSCGGITYLYTPSSGAYTINNVPSGNQTCFFYALQSLAVEETYASRYNVPVIIYANQTVTFNISLPPYTHALFYVYDSITGLGITGADISLSFADPTLLFLVGNSKVTDSNGYFLNSYAVQGEQTINVYANNYQSYSGLITVAGGGSSFFNIPLSSIPTVAGRITDFTTGSGIANATVNLIDSNGNISTYTQADANGYYVRSASGGNFLLSASAAGYTNNSAEITVPITGTITVDLGLMPAGMK